MNALARPRAASPLLSSILFVTLVALAVVLSACRGSSTATPTPTSSAVPTVIGAPGATPTSATAVATAAIPVVTPGPMPSVLQQAISAVLQRQPAPLAAMVTYQQLPCTTAAGAGGPPKCQPGDAAGTTYRVFPAGRCEAEWVTDGRTTIEQWVSTVGNIYAAVTIPAASGADPAMPKADYVLVFSGKPGGPGGYLLLGANNQVLRASYLCETGPGSEELLIRRLNATSYVIPPPVAR